jgi:hypothetical protein
MEQIAMGAPNIQQQLYLKKALNENTDNMFEHTVGGDTITEGLLAKIKSSTPKKPIPKMKPVAKPRNPRLPSGAGGTDARGNYINEGSRGKAKHERINQSMGRLLKRISKPGTKINSPEFLKHLGFDMQSLDRAQIARERQRAGLSPKIPSSSVVPNVGDPVSGKYRTVSDPDMLGQKGGKPRVPKKVQKYREVSGAKAVAGKLKKGIRESTKNAKTRYSKAVGKLGTPSKAREPFKPMVNPFTKPFKSDRKQGNDK